MIETKLMAAEANRLPHINENNVLVGSVPALKLFVCKHGVDTANDTLQEAISGIQLFSLGTTIDVSDNKIVTNSTNGALGMSSEDLPAFSAGITIGATDDALIIGCGSASATSINDVISFGITDVSTFASLVARARPTGAITPAHFADDVGVSTSSAADAAPLYVADGTDYVLSAAIERGGNVTGNRNAGTVATTLAEKTAALGLEAEATFATEPAVTIRANTHAMAMFVFQNGLPSNWRAQANLMAWNWARGNFVFPSSWANFS